MKNFGKILWESIKKKANFSVSNRIFLLISLVILPSLILILVKDFIDIMNKKNDFYLHLKKNGQYVAEYQILNMSFHKRFLLNLSHYSSTEQFNQKNYNSFLHKIIHNNLFYNNLIVLDPKGNVLANALPVTDPHRIKERNYLKSIRKLPDFQISELITYEQIDQPAIPIALPIQANGKLQCIFVAGCLPEAVFVTPSNLDLPPGSAVLFIDRNGQIINRQPRDIHIGHKIPSEIFSLILKSKSDSGFFKTHLLDNLSRIYVTIPVHITSNAPDFFILYGVPSNSYFFNIYKDLILHLLFFVFIIIITTLIALYSGKHLIYNNIKELVVFSENISQGIYQDEFTKKITLMEFKTLYESFTKMEKSIRDRENRLITARNDLMANKEFMKTLLKNLSGLVFQVKNDQSRSVEFYSDGIFELTGYQVSDFYKGQLSYHKLISPHFLDLIWIEQQKALIENTYYQIEYQIKTAGNNFKWVFEKGCGIYDQNNQPLSIIGFVTDITNLKKAETEILNQKKKLTEQEKLFHSLFDNMKEGVSLHKVLRDDNGLIINYRIINVNKSFESILPLTKDQVINKLASEAYNSEIPPYLKEYIAVMEDQKSSLFEDYYQPLKMYIQVSVVPIDDDHFATIFSDITKQKMHNMELERVLHELKQKNSELEDIIYISSHDLKTPLVNIQGYSGKLNDQIKQLSHLLIPYSDLNHLNSDFMEILQAKIPKSLDYIIKNTAKINNLLDALLKLNRSNRIQLNCQIIEPNEIIQIVLAHYDFQIQENNISIHALSLSPCYADFNLLTQVFFNLIDNAIKYRSENRNLIIDIFSNEDEQYLLYHVQDNGIGIQTDMLNEIFDLFYQIHNSQSGNGLGLTISQSILEKHNGFISVNSAVDKGSEFIIHIPKINF